MVEEAQIVVHKAHQPDALTDFAHAVLLTSEHPTEVDLSPADADAATGGDRERASRGITVASTPELTRPSPVARARHYARKN